MSEYFDLQSKLEDSETQENIKQDLAEDIQAAESILRYFKNEYGQDSDRYQKVFKEYTELRQTTISALQSERQIIESELVSIKEEFEDIKELESYGDFLDRVTSKDFIYSNVSEAIHTFNDSFSKEEIIELLENIKEYVSDEVSEDLSKVVDSLKKAKWKSPVLMLKITNIMWKLSGTSWAHNTAQEKYLRKIFWADKWYNTDYIAWYNNEVWNYVVKTDKFERKIQSSEVKDINSKALANYFMSLENKGGLNEVKLFKLFGKQKLIQLWELWKTKENEQDTRIAKSILEQNWFWEIIVRKILDFSKLIEDRNFLDTIDTLDNQDMDVLLETITNKPEERWNFLLNINNWYYSNNYSPKKRENNIINMLKWSNDSKYSKTCELSPKVVAVLDKAQKIELNEKKETIISILKEKYIKLWIDENEAEKISHELLGKLSDVNPPCLSEYITVINNFYQKKSKEHQQLKGMKVNKGDVSWIMNKVVETKEIKNEYTLENTLRESNISEEEINNNSNNLEIYLDAQDITEENKKIILESYRLKKQIKEVKKRIKIVSDFNDDEFNEYLERLENWEDWKKAIQEVIEKYEDRKENELALPPKLPETNSAEFSLDTSWSKPTLKSDWETIELSDSEAEMIHNWNEQAQENIINFYSLFKELNLLSIWKYRTQLTTSIWKSEVNLEDDSLKESELVQFGNSLIKSINKLPNEEWEKNIYLNENSTSLSWMKAELRKFSWADSNFSDDRTFNVEWEDRFWAYLRNMWIIWWAYFKINTFRELIK